MNRESLRRLKRADLQKLAKRDGVRANQKTESIIDGLLQKNDPVPYMYSIPPTSELEAISRKVLRGTVLGGARKQTAPQAESSSLRRSPRKSGTNDAPVPGTEAASPPASQNVRCPSSSPKTDASPRAGPSNGRRSQSGRKTNPESDAAVPPRPLETQPQSAGPDNATTAKGDSAVTGSVVGGPREIGDKSAPAATVEPAVVQPSLARFMWRPPQPTQIPPSRDQRPWPLDRPDRSPFRGVGSRVFYPPTESELAAMRERARDPPVVYSPRPPVFSLPPQETKRVPEPAKLTPPRSRSASTEPAWDEVTRSPLPPWVFPRPMTEVRRVLQEITPLADRDETAKGQIRELGILIDHVEERTAKLKMRMREMQKLRLALECFFSQFKDDPRLYNGTWTPPEEEKQGSTDEEEDMAEVEDLTSREILSADLADIASCSVIGWKKGRNVARKRLSLCLHRPSGCGD